MKLTYCDYIADVCLKALRKATGAEEDIILAVSNVKGDLHPEEGYLQSTKKSISVFDTGEKVYRVTIEEVL